MTSPPAFAVSIVIPLYNKASFIRQTLESVLAQTLAAIEIIIVDDGSTDDSVGCIRDLADPSIRVVEQQNAGPGPARNRGIAEASQPWVAFIDADDLWRPDHLATLAELSKQFPEADAVASSIGRITSHPNQMPLSTSGAALDGALLDYFAFMPNTVGICSSNVAIRRPTLEKVGPFGPFFPGEDYEYWARLSLDHCIAVSARPTALYVQQTGGLMDIYENGPPIGFTLQPVYATLDRALADPRHAPKHPAIRQYRASLLRQNVRQALYRGEVDAARLYIAELEKSGPARLGVLRVLSWLPTSVVRTGISMRRRLKRLNPAPPA